MSDDNTKQPLPTFAPTWKPTGPEKKLNDDETMVDHIARGDCNWDAYPAETHPWLKHSFRHWQTNWKPFLDAATTEEGQYMAAFMVSSAWRIYVGRCVRLKDLLPLDGEDAIPDHIAAHFPSTRADPNWWFTPEGHKQGLEWLEAGRFPPGS